MRIEEVPSFNISVISPLVLAMCEEVKEPIDLDYFINSWIYIVESSQGTVFTFNKTEGVIGCILAHHPLTGKLMAYLMLEYMKPPYRGKYGIRLFQRFEEWAKEKGAVLACAGHNNNLIPDSHSAMLNRHGYTKRETIWVKEL